MWEEINWNCFKGDSRFILLIQHQVESGFVSRKKKKNYKLLFIWHKIISLIFVVAIISSSNCKIIISIMFYYSIKNINNIKDNIGVNDGIII